MVNAVGNGKMRGFLRNSRSTRRTLRPFSCGLVSIVFAFAQVPKSATPKTVLNLWPGAAPGSEQWKQPETVVGSVGNRRIMNVSTPTLSVYVPDPATATGTAVIIAPGGGFVWLSIDSEGHDAAKWLAARGIAGIVLKYRLFRVEGQDPAQITHAQDDTGAGPLVTRFYDALKAAGARNRRSDHRTC